MTVWDTFFMMLMVIPVSKMLSSIFMKLIARVGTIDEEKYAAMGMGTILTVAAIAGVGKNKMGRLGGRGAAAAGGSGDGGGGGGGSPSSGACMAGLGEASGAGPAGPSSAAMDFLGMDAGEGSGTSGEMGAGASPGGAGAYAESYGAEGATAGCDMGAGAGADLGAGVPPIGEAPLGDISQRAGDIGDRASVYGAYTGALAPVAAPVVAGIMAFTTRAMVGPAVAGHQVTKSLKESYRGNREGGMGRADAISRSAMDLTGAGSPSEASARILGGVLGASLGSGGSRFSSNALGGATKFVNNKSAWIKDKIM